MNPKVLDALHKLAANATPQLQRFVGNPLHLMSAIAQKESGWDMQGGNISKWGPKSSWSPYFIRTRIRPTFDEYPKGTSGYRPGATAFGPMQFTRNLHRGLVDKYPSFANQHRGIISKLDDQYGQFLKYGRTAKQARLNLLPKGVSQNTFLPSFDYGGKGSFTEQDYLPYINYLKDATDLLYTQEIPQKGLTPAQHMDKFIQRYRFGTGELTPAQQRELVQYRQQVLSNLYKYHPEYFQAESR